MIADLSALIAPLSEAEFRARLRDRALTLVPGTGAGRFAGLLDWDTLNHLLAGGVYPLAELRIVRESIPVPANFYARDGRVDGRALGALMTQGVSLIFNRLDHYVPALQRLCAAISAETAEQISAGAIVTSGAGGALERHFDPEDILILQIAGTKRWQVFGDAVLDPVAGMRPPAAPRSAPVFDQVLSPGDLLLLPAGHWHHCENGPGRSLHAGIMLTPPTGRDLVQSFATSWLDDELFRAPLSRYADATALSAHEEALKARLIERVRTSSLDEFVSALRTTRAATNPVRLEGQDQ